MPKTATLRTWHDDRGFGFIAPTDGGPEIFVHISAFPRDGSRPTVGEKLTYELGPGRDGKPQATRVVRLAVGTDVKRGPGTTSRRPDRTNWFVALVVLALVGGLGTYAYDHFEQVQKRRALANQPATSPVPAADQTTPAGFRCDGRTHCSQMTSCAEAKWFINHCPGTQMDGNNDGVPCEQQWCKSSFSR
jgi:cold shock CspA family protein